ARERIADCDGQFALGRDRRQAQLQPLVQLVEQGSCACTSNRLPLVRWPSADLAFDLVECTDPGEGLLRDRRAGRLVDVVELAPNVRPTSSLHDTARLVKTIEAGIAVRLQNAAEALQVLGRVSRLAIGRVAEPDSRRRLVTRGTIVANVGPQPPGLGRSAPGLQHR